MRAVPLTFLLLALACKTESSTPAPQAQPATGNPHAGLDPATAARAEAARAAGANGVGSAGSGAEATAASLQPHMIAPHTLPELPGGGVALGPFALQVPADWKAKPVLASMRAAEFQLPESSGKAEVIVYYFGENGAGSVQDNLDRWVSQFTQPDGKPSKEVAKVEQASFAGQPATVLSVSGRYASRAMPGTEAVDKENQSMLAAIVPSPSGPYYFRLIGDRAAVEAQAGKFREMLGALKLH